MKTKIFIAAFILCSIVMIQNAQAQIVMHENGQITLLESTTDWTKGIQVFPEGIVHFNTSQSHDGHWVTAVTPGHVGGKCWIVTAPGNKYTHRFYVKGNGIVYMHGSLIMSNYNIDNGDIMNNAGNILDGITGRYYTLEDEGNTRKENRKISISAREVEKVLPEAVTKDENDLLYVDYNALTVVLIEAYKEQKAEIEVLRKTLEEHGLLKPEK